MADKQHAKLAPSAAKRWMNCPGCIRLSAGIKEKPSFYAEEGTLAHWLAEMTLKNNSPSTDTVGGPWNNVKALGLTVPEISKTVKVDQDMIYYTQQYVDLIRGDNLLVGNPIAVETHVDLSWLYPDIFGTADTSAGEPFELLRVYDFKYSAGVVVEPDENPQQMIYALGDLGPDNPNMFNEVEIVIHQPRIPHTKGPVRRWRISVKDLYEWGHKVLKPCAERTYDPNAPLSAGEWCRFCPALEEGICKEVVLHAAQSAAIDFAPDTPVEQIVSNVHLPDYGKLTVEQCAKALEFSKILAPWIAGLETFVQSRIESGMKIPGWKLVNKKGGNRKWIDKQRVIDNLALFYGDAIYNDPNLKSPAQMEKIPGINKAALSQFWDQPKPGVTIAPTNDSRPEVPPTAVLDFLA